MHACSIEPVVKFRPTETVVARQISPEVGFFSSREPSSLSPHVLKLDIAAPGVNILAPFSPVSTLNRLAGGLPPQKFRIESGTSSACPLVSRSVALLKSIHPTWSPAALKSAIVTTDGYGQHIVAEGLPYKEGDPFDYGGGDIEPNEAFDQVSFTTRRHQIISISFAYRDIRIQPSTL